MLQALYFSGGNDSLALLMHERERWDDTLVMWCDTGAAYPSTIEQMREVEEMVPHFMAVKSDQPGNIKVQGWPTDILPARSSPIGQLLADPPARFQLVYDCCGSNIWYPLLDATRKEGIRLVLRGDRRSQPGLAGGPSRYDETTGIQYEFPLWEWTDAMVSRAVEQYPSMVSIGYRQGELKSRACWDCTGYLAESAKRIENLPVSQRAKVVNRLIKLREALQPDLEELGRWTT